MLWDTLSLSLQSNRPYNITQVRKMDQNILNIHNYQKLWQNTLGLQKCVGLQKHDNISINRINMIVFHSGEFARLKSPTIMIASQDG